ncbi:MAG: C4-dicarboxylate ABC transporter, partial [Sutterella sp.]
MFGVICTLIAVAGIAYFVIKNIYPPTILLLFGLVLLLIGAWMGNAPVSPKSATNFLGFDLAQAFTDLMKGRLPGLGLN